MSGLKLHKEESKYYLTRNGKRVGVSMPKISLSFEWRYITVDIDAEAKFSVVGDFLLLISDSTPFTSSNKKSLHLCLFEEEPTEYWGGQERAWQELPLLYYPDRTTFAELIEATNNLRTFNGAVYLPMNPGVSCKNDHKSRGFVDMTSKGRWLFPHPDGSRAAYEHMQETTSEDDYQRMMPHFDEYPELLETFADLI